MGYPSGKGERTTARIEELLGPRLRKLGSIRSNDAWELCRQEFNYASVCIHFKIIMEKMACDGKAEHIKRGVWWISKNQFVHGKEKTRL